MIKRILLPLDSSAYTDYALKFAISVAKYHDSEITGLVILDIPGIEKSVTPVTQGAIHYVEKLEPQKEKQVEELIEKLLTKFRKACQESGTRYQEAHLQGSPSERILAESIYYDAVVIGLRTYFHFGTSQKSGNSIINMLSNSLTPIYAIPQKYEMPSLESTKLKILITISDFFSSARALQRFVQVAIPESVEISMIAGTKNEDTGLFHLNQAEQYLNTHGFKVLSKEWTSRKLSDVIDEKYIGKIDIIVIGNDLKKGLLSVFANNVIKNMAKLNRIPLLIG